MLCCELVELQFPGVPQQGAPLQRGSAGGQPGQAGAALPA